MLLQDIRLLHNSVLLADRVRRYSLGNIVLIALTLIMGCSCAKKVIVENVSLSCDSQLGYTAIKGPSTDAYLLLFPGFGETSSDVLSASDLPTDLAKHNITVFIPTLQNGAETYGWSDKSQVFLKEVISDICGRYDLGGVPYVLGGFSMGGATAIKYAEKADTKPKAIFAIDSPLDYKRFLYATKRDIDVYNKDTRDSIYAQLYKEVEMIKDDSPYEIDDATHAAIMPLKDIPVRIYIEPAIDWWLNERSTDALGLNVIDASCFVNDLRLIGNQDAELIVTQGKGYRKSTHQRHPHSWTIVDSGDLIKWLRRFVNLDMRQE